MTESEIKTLAREIAVAQIDAVSNLITAETANWPSYLVEKIPDESQADDAARLRAFRALRPEAGAWARTVEREEEINTKAVEDARVSQQQNEKRDVLRGQYADEIAAWETQCFVAQRNGQALPARPEPSAELQGLEVPVNYQM